MNRMFGLGMGTAKIDTIQENFTILQKEIKNLQKKLEHENKLRRKNQWKRNKKYI